ncbi:MAG: TonB-dependent receptor [Acidobacteria bacterium]|nr:TonB-dependent receptor [Acidobacteriota bacterium]
MIRRYPKAARLLPLAFLIAWPVDAQVPTTGRLAGFVKDEAGTPQRGIEITLVFTGSRAPGAAPASAPRRVLTDVRGFFLFDQLEPGVYQLSGVRAGLSPLNLAVEVAIARAKVVEVVLGRSSAQATTAEVAIDQGFKAKIIALLEFELAAKVKEPVVNTREALLGSSFEPGRLTALPLQGRNYLDVLLLQPGTAPGNGGEGFGSFNGGRASSQNFSLDGTENTDADVALPSLFQNGAVALDAIQEYRIVTSNANAEFGRNSGGQISLFIRRGTAEFPGGAYEFFRSSAFDARDFFSPDPRLTGQSDKPHLLRHQFGGHLGGPIWKSSHFFFGSYEGYRNRQSIPAHPRVPTAELRRQLRGVFADVDIDRRTGFPFSGPSPLLTALFNLPGSDYPLPNRPVVNPATQVNPSDIGIFDTLLPFSAETHSFIVRTDHQWTRGHQSRFRYAGSSGNESPLGNGIPGTSAGKDFRTQNVSIVHTTLISDRQVNEFRFGFSRNRVEFPTEPAPARIQTLANQTISQAIRPVSGETGQTFAELYPDIRFGLDNSGAGGFPSIGFFFDRFSNLGVDADRYPQGRARNTFQFGDSYSIAHRRHAFRAGFDIRRLQQNSISGYNLRPSFIIPDYSLETLFTDRTRTGRQNFFFTQSGQPGGPILRGLRSTEYGFFGQDNIRLTGGLNLDLGLRYEIFGRETEAHNFLSRAVNYRFVGFSPAATLDPAFHTESVSDAIGKTVRHGDHNNLGPRIGLAWDLFGDGRTSLRAAYGIYYDHIQGSTIFPNELNPPGVLGFVIPDNTRIGAVPAARASGGSPRPCMLPSGGTGLLNTAGDCLATPLSIIDPHFRDPYVQRWNVTLQRELDRDTAIELSYVGSKGTHLARARTPNLGPFIDEPALANGNFFGRARPNPGLGAVTVQESSASSVYHAAQLQVQRRLSRSLGFQVAYTYSQSVDDVSSNVVDAGAGGSIFPQNSFDYSSERGLSAFHTRHRVAINYVYDLPIGPGQYLWGNVSGMAARLTSGWSVSGITVFQTGFPLTFLSGEDTNADGVFNDRPLLVGDLAGLRPSGGSGDVTQYFGNPAGILTGLFTGPQGVGSPFFDPTRPPALYVKNLIRPLDPNLLVGRGSFTGPGRNSFDFALRKVTLLGRSKESVRLEFRAEFYNLFNHTNFADPDTKLTSPQFGQITATSIPARQVQFALKLGF